MKLSMYAAKKWAAFMLAGFLPLLIFIMSLFTTKNLLISYVIGFVAIIVSAIFCIRIIRHPWLVLIEGNGVAAAAVDSTGIVAPMIAQMPAPPEMNMQTGKGKMTTDLYERGLVHTLLIPQKTTVAKAQEVNEEGEVVGEKLVMVLPFDDFDKLFNLEGKPLFIYNRVLGTFVGKGILSQLETESTLLHAVNHLVFIMKKLAGEIRPFSSYVIEQLKPKGSWLEGKMKWILIAIIVIIIMAIVGMFGPQLMSAMKGISNLAPGGGTHIP